ncbi:flavodoxin family protein [Rhizobium sp. AB2/73]|uniref:flavodoxin family protein n=1 Tax=Rhizobium sp. AB2/73 TaxID=2795216 RepID=UPI001C5FC114|nr:flavodoxin family protein [Rhizobium sp. AB2/73]QYA13188.1 flavodoxin family protein [Rhizobium sp. AB2/73]UEQ80879.1 flavodoxin family protein [Rhizobium sp. AB2/73]
MARKLLILVGSPRRDGNTVTLAQAVQRGAEATGAQVALRILDDYVSSFLRDCRTCRQQSGECTIPDRYRALFFEDFLSSDSVVLCSPIYWYGLSGQAKSFLDRSFCYYAASYPGSKEVLTSMSGKRIGLVLASEETYPGAALGIIHQIQEFARYTHSKFIGVVRGVGNSRGDVRNDPGRPIASAESLGAEIFSHAYSDYRLDSARKAQVWPFTCHSQSTAPGTTCE